MRDAGLADQSRGSFAWGANHPRSTSNSSDRQPGLPPVGVVDEIARAEWARVTQALLDDSSLTLSQQTLLAGYCNAVAKATRAEETLLKEGRYYETTTVKGSIMRRRHPAALDAEQGWSSAQKLAEQLGMTGVALGEYGNRPTNRRRLFK